MKKITLPKNTEFHNGDAPNSGSVIIHPCYPGYGMTIGNALRRVLLSSLPGAAVIGVKIGKADHEFSSVPHIKEDVLELILNFKNIKLKLYSDEIVRLRLKAHGEKVVKASDIEKNSSVDIINKDAIIANITDMAGNLDVEIFVANGVGYETIESRENEAKELGYIEMDSIFSPVSKVGIKVENIRVGKMTNWEKLILDISTDGTISVEDAFQDSVSILIEQFSSLVNLETSADREKKAKAEKKKIEDESKKEEETNKITEEDEKAELTDSDDEPVEKKKRGRPKKDS